MLKISTLSSILLLFLISPFVSQAQDITKEKMIAYFDAENMCYSYSPLDVPEIAPKIIKSDSLTQILTGMQEQAQTLSEDELEVLETEYQEVLSKYQMLQDEIRSANKKHCEELLEHSGLNLTFSTFLEINETLDKKDNQEVLNLHDEVVIERFNALMNNSKPIIEGMDDDTFLTHLSYYVEYFRRQQEAQEATSEREAFRKETELADYYQSLISKGKISNEQMEKLNDYVKNGTLLAKVVEALFSNRISLR